MAFWPALLLARERAPARGALRGLLAGGAVLLAEVALLSQSRGSLYATPVMLVLVFALLPGRARTFALLVPVAAGDRGGRAGGAARRRTHRTRQRRDQRACTTPPRRRSSRRWSWGWSWPRAPLIESGVRARGGLAQARAHGRRRASALATLVAVLAGGWVAAGNPVTRASNTAGTRFKSGSGYGANSVGGSRLTSGLGSNRYDFYRVALDEFVRASARRDRRGQLPAAVPRARPQRRDARTIRTASSCAR